MSNKTFTIHIDAIVDLAVGDIWPDGAAPDDPTDADVVAAMKACGSKWTVLNDWCLLDDLVVVVGNTTIRVWY